MFQFSGVHSELANRGIPVGSYLVKNILELVLRQSRALDVLNRTQLLCHAVAVFLTDGLHLLSGKLLPNARVVAQISLCTDDETGDTGAMVMHFREPFLPDVLE